MSRARRIARAVAEREAQQRLLERKSHRLICVALRGGYLDEAAYHLAEATPRYRAAVAFVSFASRLGLDGSAQSVP